MRKRALSDLRGEFHGIDGDLVVTRTWLTGRGRGSGLTLGMRIRQSWTFRGAKVVRYEAHPSWEQALEAAGLRE